MTEYIKAVSLDPNDFKINWTSLKNDRQIIQKYIANNIKKKCVNLNLLFGIVHWDLKLLPTIVGNKIVIDF